MTPYSLFFALAKLSGSRGWFFGGLFALVAVPLWLIGNALKIRSAGFFDALGTALMLLLGSVAVLYGLTFVPPSMDVRLVGIPLVLGTWVFLKSAYETSPKNGLMLTTGMIGSVLAAGSLFVAYQVGPQKSIELVQAKGPIGIAQEIERLASGESESEGSSSTTSAEAGSEPSAKPTETPAEIVSPPEPAQEPVPANEPEPAPAPEPEPEPTPQAEPIPDPEPAPEPAPRVLRPPEVTPPPPTPKVVEPIMEIELEPEPKPVPLVTKKPKRDFSVLPPGIEAPKPVDRWGPESKGRSAPTIRAVDGYGENASPRNFLGRQDVWLVFLDTKARGAAAQDSELSNLESHFASQVAFLSVLDMHGVIGDPALAQAKDWGLKTGRSLETELIMPRSQFPQGRPGVPGKPRHVLIDKKGKIQFVYDGFVREAKLKARLQNFLDRRAGKRIPGE